MNQEAHILLFPAQIACGSLRVQYWRRHCHARHWHAAGRTLKRSPFGNLQITQCKQHDLLRAVLGPPMVTHPCATGRTFGLTQWGLGIGPHAALHLPRLAYQAGQKRAPIQRIAPRRVWQVASCNKRNVHHGLALDGCSACLEVHVRGAARALQNWSDSKARISYVRTSFMWWA